MQRDSSATRQPPMSFRQSNTNSMTNLSRKTKSQTNLKAMVPGIAERQAKRDVVKSKYGQLKQVPQSNLDQFMASKLHEQKRNRYGPSLVQDSMPSFGKVIIDNDEELKHAYYVP